MSKYHQGAFVPRNIDKYVGDPKTIFARSSWERKVMIWLDNNPSILKWNSEGVVVPYISPVDNLPHRYFPDFTVMFKQKDGSIKKAILEIKPNKETKPPVAPKRQTQRYITEVKTYAVNQAKWNAAVEYCKKMDMLFLVLDEYALGIK